MAEQSAAQSTCEPLRAPDEDLEASPSSNNPMEAKIQQLVANNQVMHEQMNTLKDAMQTLLTRLPPVAQGSISQES